MLNKHPNKLMADVYESVRDILSNLLKINKDKIQSSTTLSELGVDSVDFWEIVAKLEKKFKIHVKDERSIKVETVQDIADIIVTCLQRKKNNKKVAKI
jgi:acyl carrier protein